MKLSVDVSISGRGKKQFVRFFLVNLCSLIVTIMMLHRFSEMFPIALNKTIATMIRIKLVRQVVCGCFLKKHVVKKSNTYFKILRKNSCFIHFLCYIYVIKYNIRGRVYVFDKEEIESGRSWRGEVE